MKKSMRAATAALLFGGALALGMPTAVAAPVQGESAEDAVSRLEREGYNVVVTRTGTAPLDQCQVGSIRRGRDVMSWDRGQPWTDGLVPTYQQNVHLEARCPS